jgi:hypothetical protein
VCASAISALTEADGRASGLKFNKLLYHVHKELGKSKDPNIRFQLAYRWYLYGAATEMRTIADIVGLTHPEDEYRTDVHLLPSATSKPHDSPGGFSEEVELICHRFAGTYRGTKGIAPMLRAHYEDAPEDFQRDFLEWSLQARGILGGYILDSPSSTLRMFQTMVKSYPSSLEPRLTPAFHRLAIYLEPLIAERRQGEFAPLRKYAEALWDFWSIFVLFLSVKYNNDIPPPILPAYRERAESELDAYKRRLSAFLQAGYLEESDSQRGAGFEFREVSQFLASEVREALNGVE